MSILFHSNFEFFAEKNSNITLYRISLRGPNTHLDHSLVPSSRFSNIYPVIGEPPSYSGRDHCNVIASSAVAMASGWPGGPGVSEIVIE